MVDVRDLRYQAGRSLLGSFGYRWAVGHSYLVYAQLLHGATTIRLEGKPIGTPNAGTFWRIIAEYGIAALFTAPTSFLAIRKEHPDGHVTVTSFENTT